jgi:hypothetical protein
MTSQLITATRKQMLDALRVAVKKDRPVSEPGMEAHHTGPKFVTIADEFITTRNITEVTVKVNGKGLFPQLVDRALGQEFRAFHATRATLVMLTHEQHVAVHQAERRM